MSNTTPEGAPKFKSTKELGYHSLAKFIVTAYDVAHEGGPEYFAGQNLFPMSAVTEFCEGDTGNLLNAKAGFAEKGWLRSEIDRGQAHYHGVTEQAWRDWEIIKGIAQGILPKEFRSGVSRATTDTAKTSHRIMRALASDLTKGWAVKDLATSFDRNYLTVKKALDQGVDQGWYETMDHHRKAMMRGRAPKFYFITERGLKQYKHELSIMSQDELALFQQTSAKDLLAVAKVGQFKDPNDAPDTITDEAFEYFIKYGEFPPVNDDDEIPM
jgi:hypothetical protein